MARTPPPQPESFRRKEASEQRRQAILDAGLAIFAAQGFSAARLDDVAEKAGVAKGTIYLFFKDKEDLFEQIVLGAASPVLVRLGSLAEEATLPFSVLLARLLDVFKSEILDTSRKEIIKLVVTEGGRFPRIGAFYHREVIAKGTALMRKAARRAYERGELPTDAIARFPHLVFAPLLMSALWDGPFARVEPLDVPGLLGAHRDVLLGSSRKTTPGAAK